ncbi:ImmA/IrrE family metallo-endopeptidase [Pseudarthrobacter sp. MDT3-28]|uniref:ImmA/IrrE family metallo-endopeptidase n=1 Tax=Pseudarthrobacter raffinosi TaxID=2953651 RepID=UPI00208EF885|nr:ImmA/IrrE family metallo-endopeptidase [Pseudarthrobacter sp. MDT3-28]MCO4239484.1 ImmA/IrrE family metallo-endopeptidase [Pseudarthrobacter sp. MDT3-28]
MAVQVPVSPEVLRWAVGRSGKDFDSLTHAFRNLPGWLSGEVHPTFPQLEKFAAATYVPLGRFFVADPPEEKLSITDFRRVPGAESEEPSANLLDAIDLCRARQDWYRDYIERVSDGPRPFVNSLTVRTAPRDAAERIRHDLKLSPYTRPRATTWDLAFSALVDSVEALGVLVMVSGVVGANTRRKLNHREFRGFTLSDPLAPVIFVNGADSRAATIFTLIHEIGHVYLGESGVSKADPRVLTENSHEQWCNRVAAEFLMPDDVLRSEYRPVDPGTPAFSDELDRLAFYFKVSALAVLMRLSEANIVRFADFGEQYESELARAIRAYENRPESTGGNFYNTEGRRVSKRFARAIIGDTVSGETLHRDAFRLLGIKTTHTFQELGQRMGAV